MLCDNYRLAVGLALADKPCKKLYRTFVQVRCRLVENEYIRSHCVYRRKRKHLLLAAGH